METDRRAEIIQEARVIYEMNERLVRELDEICGSLAIPPAKFEEDKAERSFLHRNKLPLTLSIIGTFWVIKYWYWTE